MLCPLLDCSVHFDEPMLSFIRTKCKLWGKCKSSCMPAVVAYSTWSSVVRSAPHKIVFFFVPAARFVRQNAAICAVTTSIENMVSHAIAEAQHLPTTFNGLLKGQTTEIMYIYTVYSDMLRNQCNKVKKKNAEWNLEPLASGRPAAV